MKTVSQYLDQAKKITGSDYKTAMNLEVTRQAISHMRTNGTMSNENAAKIAALLSVDLAEVIAACEIGKHPEKKHFWAKWVAATVILSAGILTQDVDFSADYAAFSPLPAIYYAHI